MMPIIFFVNPAIYSLAKHYP